MPKKNEVKTQIPSITILATTTVFTVVENKTPMLVIQLKRLTITQSLIKLKRKLMILPMINILQFPN